MRLSLDTSRDPPDGSKVPIEGAVSGAVKGKVWRERGEAGPRRHRRNTKVAVVIKK
jgi:hypothetical protein